MDNPQYIGFDNKKQLKEEKVEEGDMDIEQIKK